MSSRRNLPTIHNHEPFWAPRPQGGRGIPAVSVVRSLEFLVLEVMRLNPYFMLDCVTARRLTSPAYGAGLQCGLERSRRPCARIAKPALPPASLRNSRGACPSSLTAPPHYQPTFEREILSDRPLSGAAIRVCMLFLSRGMLSCTTCCCRQQFSCPPPTPFLLQASYLSR
jgi:hypothetical protein